MSITPITQKVKWLFIADVKNEFPDYDDIDFDGIDIPPGFKSSAWHNDTCPSIINEAKGLKIFIDYKEPENRENDSFPRFSLYKFDKETDQYEWDSDTDEWADILAAL